MKRCRPICREKKSMTSLEIKFKKLLVIVNKLLDPLRINEKFLEHLNRLLNTDKVKQ